MAVEPIDTIGLDELVRFFRSPPTAFLTKRLGIYLRDEDDEQRDRALNGLNGCHGRSIPAASGSSR